MKVRAKRLGYYGHRRRREGDTFDLEPIKKERKDSKTGRTKEVIIAPEQQFSERWMERLGPAPKPAKVAKDESREPVALSEVGKKAKPPVEAPKVDEGI